MTISNLPPKGTYDWFPEEFSVRKYIFDTWRKVCLQFGYEEYMTPILEYSEIYKAKSGEDVGGKELMIMQDRAGRELSIRPEMTPSVTRMVTRIYENAPKPLRLFSIANFFRNEKPQKGRNREFWQLNADIFGSDSLNADIEVLQLALEIMIQLGAPKGSFILFINNRKLIETVLNDIANISVEQRTEVVRILDKWEKLSPEEFAQKLKDLSLNEDQIENLRKFMSSTNKDELLTNLPILKDNAGYKETVEVLESLNIQGYSEWVRFQPSIIRGFDYYDGLVFEVFDTNPENKRSLFGGGRYNGLAGIFGSKSFPAVGFAPGDETLKIFLEENNLLEGRLNLSKTYYLPILSEELSEDVTKLAKNLRAENKNIKVGLEVQKLGKALEYSNKIKADFLVILGEEEKKTGQYLIKEMATGEQKSFAL